MRCTNSPRDWLIAATLTNYVTYSCWTLLNKYQFASLGTDCPVFSTAIQMLIAGGIAIAVSVAAHGQVLSASTTRNVQQQQQQKQSSSETAAELLSSSPSSSPRTVRSILSSQILPLGIARSIDIGCGNAALFLVSVALQQILKSLLPLFVCALSLFVLRKNSSSFVWLSLIPIVAGSGLSAFHEHDGGGTTKDSSSSSSSSALTIGATLALVSTFGRSLKAVLNSKLVMGSANALPLRPLEVLSLEAPTSGVILLFASLVASFFWTTSSLQQHHDQHHEHHRHPTAGEICSVGGGTFVWVNTVAGALMFFNQLSYISVIKFSSALTCQVLMNVKMLILIVVSIFLFHTPVSTLNALGMFLALAGCFLYAMAQWGDSETQKRKLDEMTLSNDNDGNVDDGEKSSFVVAMSPI